MRIVKLVPLAVAGAIFAVSLAAQDTPAPARRSRADFAGRADRTAGPAAHLNKVLNLSSAQQQKAHEIFADLRVKTQDLGPKLRTAHASLRDAARRGASNEEIDKISQDAANVQAQMSASHAKAMAALYSTLTADQKKTFDERPELMGGGFGGLGGPRARRAPQAAQ